MLDLFKYLGRFGDRGCSLLAVNLLQLPDRIVDRGMHCGVDPHMGPPVGRVVQRALDHEYVL